jgi:hypothetical protein
VLPLRFAVQFCVALSVLFGLVHNHHLPAATNLVLSSAAVIVGACPLAWF